jgi:hypothetical protein
VVVVGGYGHGGGSGGGQQEPPPQLVKPKEPLPVVPVDDPKQRAPQQSKARLAMRERIVNAQPHDPNMVRLPDGSWGRLQETPWVQGG